jgi:hypothetical protein
VPHPTTTLTRRALLRTTAATLGLASAALLAACGNTSSAPQASAPAAAALPSTTSATPEPATLPAFNGIPQSHTPEGYPTLGAPDAPVTMLDYSDFL